MAIRARTIRRPRARRSEVHTRERHAAGSAGRDARSTGAMADDRGGDAAHFRAEPQGDAGQARATGTNALELPSNCWSRAGEAVMNRAAWISGPALALALAIAGCAASAPPAPARHSAGRVVTAPARDGEGRVIGTFIRMGGPLGPGGKQPPDRLLRGTVQFLAAHHRTVAVRVGRSGRFSIWLRAGTYRVSGRSPSLLEQLPSGAVRETTCSAQQQIAVVAGRALRISVVCNVP